MTAPATDPITDPESLRETVPFHEDAEVVDEETFEQIAKLGDLTPIGVENAAGEVLVARVEDDCTLKIPCGSPDPGEDYAAAAVRWVEQLTGLAVELDGIEGVWRYEARQEGTDRVASRYFVVFAGSVDTDGREAPTDDVPAEDRPAELHWVSDLPEAAVEPPGTELFFT